MIDSFILSFKLKNTYRVNSIIYSIKQIPFIKKILPNSLYKSKTLKVFGNIISSLIEIGSIFIGKLLYLYIMIFSIVPLYKSNTANNFIHIFTFLTLCGGLINTFMFNPSKDKYYAMIIMNMDAYKYTLCNYFYSLIKVIIGLIPFIMIFGIALNVNIYILLLLVIFVILVKLTISAYYLYDYDKSKKIRNENLPTMTLWIIVAVMLLICYGLPLINITINSLIFIIIFIIFLILGIISFIKIINYKKYKEIYKKILTPNNIYMLEKNTSSYMVKETLSKQIVIDDTTLSDKEGFAYFHDLFVKRHKKILTKTVKKQVVAIIIIFIIAVLGIIIFPNVKKDINQILLLYLPYFVFIMNLLNRGTQYTQAMFMNCDHSMLNFRIYRSSKVILGMFKERLKTLIKLNLLPATIIAIMLPLILFITGGTDNILNYFILFISIIAISIFFSVHYLVLYYLLQPYNINTEMKSSTYSIIQSLTYLLCYFMIDFKMSTILFGIIVSLFSIIYSFISLYLVYRFAPKTYKLRN